MSFPEVTTKDVFARIPNGGLEANAEFAWNATLWTQGICEIEKRKIGKGFPDALIRFYSEDKKKYVWMLGEYKRDKSMVVNSICQLLMYLGNFFYDTSLEGTDNFVGIISAGTDYFILIPRQNVMRIMEKFEDIWHRNFRVTPCEAYKEYDIMNFVRSNWDDLTEDSIFVDRRTENIRLDKIIKGIYEVWNLQ